MSINIIKDIFTEEELSKINEIIDSSADKRIDEALGRLLVDMDLRDEGIKNKLSKIANEISDEGLTFANCSCAIYDAKYGQPNLPPHFDGDTIDMIINFQLSSNTSWDIGLGLETYPIEDNSAVIFNPNKNIHWRPIKDFNPGEYVTMIFFRFCKAEDRSDYSQLNYNKDNEIFNDIKQYRDNLYIESAKCEN